MTPKPTSSHSQSALDRFSVLEDRIGQLIDAMDRERRARVEAERELETARRGVAAKDIAERALTEARREIHTLEARVARLEKERAVIRGRVQEVLTELSKLRKPQEKQVV